MRTRPTVFLCCCLMFGAGFASSSRAQQPCEPPPAAAAGGKTIFTDQQENDLGDAVAESVQCKFRVIDDEDYTGYLQRVGTRLLAHVPPNKLHFQFLLFDLPTANAFSLPGGRVLVSRKLIAFVRSEDELAGVLGHEIGHSIVHESAATVSRQMQIVLGITKVGDRQDVYDKFDQLIENIARKRNVLAEGKNTEEQAQLIADHIAVFAMAAAGYNPDAFPQFWDRFAQTGGKTGGFLSDLFGTSSPESRRLRDMLKALSTLPQACIDARQKILPDEFQKWQAAVVNYSGLGHKESLHAVLTQKTLDPPLRTDLNTLHFSPDGKYILAQDDSSIYVLTHNPFAVLFRFDAPGAYPAQFTPDSESIVFYDSGLRVEWWSVAEQTRTAVYEVIVQKGCLQTKLSPDGRILACYGSDFTLSLIDVASGNSVFEKKEFYRPQTFVELFQMYFALIQRDAALHLLNMAFSPDGHFFAACSHTEIAIAVDLNTHATIPLKGGIQTLMSGNFTFISPNRIAGAHPHTPDKSGIAEFPSGDLIVDLILGQQDLTAPGHGDFLILRPISNYPLGVMNLKTKKIFMATKRGAAFDIYDDEYVSERLTGELGLYSPTADQPVARLVLPRGPLSQLRATALSPDLRWLAVSQATRGAVWDLQGGQAPFNLRGFRGAYFTNDSKFYADFPKFEKTERSIALLNLNTRQVTENFKVEEGRINQRGPFLIFTKPAKKGGYLNENVNLEVQDTQTGKSLWSRLFPKEVPIVFVEPQENTLVLRWECDSSAFKTELSASPKIAEHLANVRHEKTDFFFEVLEARTGNVRGGAILETGKGSFWPADSFAAGDWLVITDNANRTLLYSISTGEQKGKIFGHRPTMSSAAGLLCVENELGQLILYDLAHLQKRDQLVFTSPVEMIQFSDDGKRLFILTANQTAYFFDVPGLNRNTTAAH